MAKVSLILTDDAHEKFKIVAARLRKRQQAILEEYVAGLIADPLEPSSTVLPTKELDLSGKARAITGKTEGLQSDYASKLHREWHEKLDFVLNGGVCALAIMTNLTAFEMLTRRMKGDPSAHGKLGDYLKESAEDFERRVDELVKDTAEVELGEDAARGDGGRVGGKTGRHHGKAPKRGRA